ncbi:MAG: discoidin domain-containing protein, partial [Bacillota bacterium]|nr:discoidin domain-containing protein [Bacillota bacterium]
MKRILSHLLACCMVLSLCSTLGAVPSSATGTPIAADELGAGSWTITATDSQGVSLKNTADGPAISNLTNIIDGNLSTFSEGGASWDGSIMVSAMTGPVDFTINFGAATTISGVRLYSRNDNTAGSIKSWDILVKFSGESDFTYLYSGQRSAYNAGDGSGVTKFGYNVTVEAVKVRVKSSFCGSTDCFLKEIAMLSSVGAGNYLTPNSTSPTKYP